MMIELPERLESALKVQANAHGISPAGYVCEVLERDLASALEGPIIGCSVQNGAWHVRQVWTGSIGRGNRRQPRRYVPELR
jgi:hypothetical protein